MPGIYINDGGAIGSSLANSINQIAQNYNPRNIAEADLIKQQTESADWDNRWKSTEIPAKEQEVLAAGQMADAIPTGQQSGVAANVAKLATNPSMSVGGVSGAGSRQVIQTQGMSPLGRLIAGRAAQGAGLDEITKGLDYGRDMYAPGSDPTTQTEIFKARSLPITTTPGQDVHLNPLQEAQQAQMPQDGNRSYTFDGSPAGPAAGGAAPAQPAVAAGTPGTGPSPTSSVAPPQGQGPLVLHGGSPYDQKVEEAQATADQTDFPKAQEAGNAAGQTIRELNDLRTLYNQVRPANAQGTTNLAEKLDTGLQQYITKMTGQPLTTKGEALQEIGSRMSRLMTGLRADLGVQRFAGPEISAMEKMLATGNMPPAVFNDVMNSIQSGLTQVQKRGQIAMQWNDAPGHATAQNIRRQWNQIGTVDPIEDIRSRYPSLLPNGGSGQPTTPGGQPDVSNAPTLTTPEQLQAIPSGGYFRSPDGVLRQKH